MGFIVFRVPTGYQLGRNSSMTLLGFVYFKGELYSQGSWKTAGPLTSRPLLDVQNGWAAICITITFRPYLYSWHPMFSPVSMLTRKIRSGTVARTCYTYERY